jgi:hypothetical protein
MAKRLGHCVGTPAGRFIPLPFPKRNAFYIHPPAVNSRAARPLLARSFVIRKIVPRGTIFPDDLPIPLTRTGTRAQHETRHIGLLLR